VVVSALAKKRVFMIKVAIVDGDDSFRQETRALLEGAEGITVVGEFQDGQKAIDLMGEIRLEARPDVILLEIGAPHAGNLGTVAQICERFPQARIIVLHDEGQEREVLGALRKGAQGHLVKGKAQPAEILQAVRAVHRGEAVLNPGVAGRMLDEVIQKHKTASK
jgi:DNA-binding NarL/FixJ family response regulator